MQPGLDVIDGAVGRRHRRAGAARLDDGGAAILHLRDEGRFEPGAVGDDFGRGPALDPGVGEIGILRVGVVAPDGDVGHVFAADACFLGQGGTGAVVVEPRHRGPALDGNASPVIDSDQAVGIAGIADDQDAHVGGGVLR